MIIKRVEFVTEDGKATNISFYDPMFDTVIPCVISGPNGSGKTRLLELIALICTGGYGASPFGVARVKAVVETGGEDVEDGVIC